jgi:hypothetical protein
MKVVYLHIQNIHLNVNDGTSLKTLMKILFYCYRTSKETRTGCQIKWSSSKSFLFVVYSHFLIERLQKCLQLSMTYCFPCQQEHIFVSEFGFRAATFKQKHWLISRPIRTSSPSMWSWLMVSIG